ncbi:MAG: hypothetical protein J6L82_01650 [Alphaproteobacteria bacterium]|nr:hypothetical protein [Alphaproteobacteria bacterium]
MIDLAAPPFTLLAERDMDLLVLEEMLSSDPFKKWLVSKLYNGTRQFRRMIGAWHTPSLEPLGSVDILFVFEEISAGHKCAILIENKIDQPKQNLQAQRYFEFGEKGVEDGYWDEYLTCLFSPQAYFSSLEPSEYFSSYLSYEEIETWFSRAAAESHSATPQRSAYKKTLIRQAIEQGTGMMRRQMQTAAAAAPVYAPVPRQPAVPGREEAAAVLTQADITPQSVLPEQTKPAPEPVIQPKKKASASDFRVFPGGVFNLPAGYREAEDTIVGKFFADMQDFAKQYYPQLGMKKPTGSAEEAAWVELAPDEFPRDVRIIHKMPQGFMDLSFAMTTLAMIQPPYQPYMDNDMAFKENGKTAVIRIMVPQIDPQQGFEQQKEIVGFALQKAQKLYQLYMHVVNNGSAEKGFAPEELYL